MKNSLPLKNHYDVCIIGGGINGAGVARECALRGLSVILLEKNDFASGTSSASSKLIHGGLRYLEQANLQLVFEACHERQLLLKNAPHLVKPLPFLLPIYKNSRRPKWQLKIGLWLYDLLSSFKNIQNHQILSTSDVLAKEPALKKSQLKGGAIYYDAQMNDSRVCLETLLHAKKLGAEIHNYTKVIQLIKDKTHIQSVKVKNTLNKKTATINASLFVNTAGPWSDTIAKKGNKHHKNRVRLSKGVHIITKKITQKHAILLTTKKDGRVYFVIPWENKTLIGTTDTDYHGKPDNIKASKEEITYLLKETNQMFPQLNFTHKDIISTFAGVRPLLTSQKFTTSAVSREHKIFQFQNLLSLLGGKYTTYRAMTEEVTKKICQQLKKPFTSLTKNMPLYGGSVTNINNFINEHYPKDNKKHPLPTKHYQHLIATYGIAYKDVLAILSEKKEYQSLLKDSHHLKGEVIYAIRVELAKTPEDFLRRRTHISLHHKTKAPCYDEVVKLFKKELT